MCIEAGRVLSGEWGFSSLMIIYRRRRGLRKEDDERILQTRPRRVELFSSSSALLPSSIPWPSALLDPRMLILLHPSSTSVVVG